MGCLERAWVNLRHSTRKGGQKPIRVLCSRTPHGRSSGEELGFWAGLSAVGVRAGRWARARATLTACRTAATGLGSSYIALAAEHRALLSPSTMRPLVFRFSTGLDHHSRLRRVFAHVLGGVASVLLRGARSTGIYDNSAGQATATTCGCSETRTSRLGMPTPDQFPFAVGGRTAQPRRCRSISNERGMPVGFACVVGKLPCA